MAAELTSTASVPTTGAVLRGAPAEMICARAKEVGADLVVMTSHGRTGFSRTWLGSVADAVMRHAAIPVLMLRPAETSKGSAAAQHAFRRVLITLDGSTLAADIVPAATALAQASGASITLLHVVRPVPLVVPIDPALPIPSLPPIPDEAATTWLVEETEKELHEEVQRLREQGGATVDAHIVVSQHVAQAIIDFARSHDIDVIAMSTHGRGASRWLMGSIADKVLRASGVPVLLRHPVATRGESTLVSSSAIAGQLPAVSGR
jgi:nucleotide-binding universal stress UspA family protein